MLRLDAQVLLHHRRVVGKFLSVHASRLSPTSEETDMSQPAVLSSVDARGVATVTLNRPEVNNAYDESLISGLHEAMDELGKQPGLRVVLLRGAGKHFQAGADLKWIMRVAAQDSAENERVSRATAAAVHRLNLLPVPVVALVQGGCFGGGTGIAAACDVVIAADNALFSIAETRWGLTAAIILPQLADAIGFRQVRRYALTGERFGAEEARRIGLAHEVVPLAGLEAAGERVVAQLLQNAPDANAQTKAAALEFAWGDVDEGVLGRLVTQHAAKRRSAEAAEGLSSFVEKRPARWTAQ
jgi:methylglutaconyl-CoA hydratase